MPIVCYCKSCNQEVPPQDICPICGKKLAKSTLELCFVKNYRPAGDWFRYSGILRLWVPVWLLIFLLPPVLEYRSRGVNGIALMLQGQYPFVMLLVMVAFVVLLFLLLLAQGREMLCYTLTAEGIQVRSYIMNPTPLQLTSRFLSRDTLALLAQGESRRPSAGLVLIRRDIIPWERVRKVKCWRQGGLILLYRPRFWRIMVIHCPYEEYPAAEEWIRTKMKRYKKVPVLPYVSANRTGKK